MSPEEYLQHDGLALGALVRQGEVTATELLELAIGRIQAGNPRLNALVRDRFEAARYEAQSAPASGPFAGVPFLVKDLLAALPGEPTGSGTRTLQRVPMPVESEMVRRWRAAGLVIAGRTATPEFGLTPYTEPEATGPTHNPWSLAHSPGGSSGGSGAAVAARWVPLASGGDGGGSIRIPAACCGVFGLKPTRGRNPTGPLYGQLWQGFVAEHVLSLSVRDSAAALDASAGDDPGAPYTAPPQTGPFLDEVAREPGRLRIAFTAQPLFGRSVHADCRAAVDDAARLLQSLGHEVEEATPPLDKAALEQAFVTVIAAETHATLLELSAALGRAARRSDVELATWSLALLGRSFSAGTLAAATATLQRAARGMAPFFARYDVLLTPTLGTPPAKTGSLQPTAAERFLMHAVSRIGAGWLLRQPAAIQPLIDKTFDYIPFTPLFNITGQPAMSVPLHWNAQGLPIGVQFAGRFGDEATLFRLAGQLERARPWRDKRPPGI